MNPGRTDGARTAYLAAEGFAAELAREIGPIEFAHDRLLVAAGPEQPAAWAQNIWLAPIEIGIDSIGDAARKLRAIQRNWAVYAPRLHRRAMLIQAQLPVVSAKPLHFGSLFDSLKVALVFAVLAGSLLGVVVVAGGGAFGGGGAVRSW